MQRWAQSNVLGRRGVKLDLDQSWKGEGLPQRVGGIVLRCAVARARSRIGLTGEAHTAP